MLNYTFVDLFCGAGGLSLGFQQGGLRCVAALDHDEAAISTYRLNFQDHVQQIEIVENTKLVDADVIAGGPPCQGFSSAGMRRPGDRRNSLVGVFAQLIVRHRPMAFVFENVEGFLTTDNGERVFDLLDPLIEAGYCIHLRKINAANYGVPQNRKRIVAIGGYRWEPTFPAPTHMAYGTPGASSSHRHLPMCPTLTDALRGLPEPTSEPPGVPQGHYIRSMSQIDRDRILRLEPGQTMRDLPHDLQHASYKRRANRRVKDGTPTERRGGAPAGIRRLDATQPSKALTTGAPSELVHPTEDRFLTPRECARIQTFPDDFSFSGGFDGCILQIANAVPPRLAEIIAQTLVSDMRKLQDARADRQGKLLSFVPTYATGMSPALQSLTDRVTQKHLTRTADRKEQLQLWD